MSYVITIPGGFIEAKTRHYGNTTMDLYFSFFEKNTICFSFVKKNTINGCRFLCEKKNTPQNPKPCKRLQVRESSIRNDKPPLRRKRFDSHGNSVDISSAKIATPFPSSLPPLTLVHGLCPCARTLVN